jgi:hypothetical protein
MRRSRITLTNGERVIFDKEDGPRIAEYRWHLNAGYAAADRPIVKGKRLPKLYMHRLIMGYRQGLEVDHINGNKLDNRRINLRVCTRAENQRNARHVSGIYYNTRRKEWIAQITVHYHNIVTGYFKTAAEASASYRTAAKLLHGRFSATARKNALDQALHERRRKARVA